MQNKTLLIIKREYLTRVRKKSFVIMMLLGPILLAGVFAAIFFLSKANRNHQQVAVYDETGIVAPHMKSTSSMELRFFPPADFTAVRDSVMRSDFNALLFVPLPQSGNLEGIEQNVQLFYKEAPGAGVQEELKKQVEAQLRNAKLRRLGVDPEEIAQTDTRIKLTLISLESDAADAGNWEIRYVLGISLAMLIYMFIFVYGAMVMRGVIEEKTNRIIEVLISTVKPFQLMMGKIVGSALVGLTQFVVWGILSFVLLSVLQNQFNVKRPVLGEGLPGVENMAPQESYLLQAISEIDFTGIFGTFLLYFLLGYLLYSSLFAAVGAAVDSETDTQQFVLPVTLPMIIAIYTGITILDNPEGPVAFWMSMIPFTSPIVMMARLPFGVPLWEIALSLSILFSSFVLTVWFTSKIYRVGILMYGKKASYKEIWKWIKMS